MARSATGKKAVQTGFAEMVSGGSSAPCVPAVREAVKAWRVGGHKGATDTSRELLKHWFENDHILPWNGRPFAYHPFQREAIETLIYLWEVERIRTRKALLERYAGRGDIRLPEHDDFVRYAVKMATGSGKTKVMSLAIAWQYLNATREDDPDYAKTFLVIAPNVIVFERLRTDFEGGRIFQADPVIPKSMKIFWELDCVMRGGGERAHSDGALFLTNIQQLYTRDEQNGDEPDAMTAVLGSKPRPQIQESADFAERIAARDGTMLVINDEAHHTHDEGNKWNDVIRSLHASRPVSAQLDFSATPRYQKGGLFEWTVYDYPLKQAIFENVVKRPVKGVAHLDEARSDVASVRYEGFLVAGVNRWREYREQLEPLGRKPILFIMMNSTLDADDVGDWLRGKYGGEFGGERTLVIHTDNTGQVQKKDLDKVRQVARRVDETDSPVNAIVSVLMLREGWDVQNVTVIVGLRPYTAKANILPEQTVGRGLRLMFRGDGSGYTERVDVIGNKAFISFVEELEKIEGLELDTFEVGKDKLEIVSIMPQPEERGAYDIGLPELTPALVRKHTLAEEIEAIDVMAFRLPTPLPIKAGEKAEQSFTYEGYDILTLEKMVEREYTIPEVQTPGEIIGYYAKQIASNLKLPSQFAALAPKVTEFFERKAFGHTVDLEDRAILKAMSRPVADYVVKKVFQDALKGLLIEQAAPELLTPARLLSTCRPFPYSRPTYAARKCIFNLVPCDNNLEHDFARFLDKAPDVAAFSKLPEQFGFAIQYVDGAANMRYYYPDFVAVPDTGEHWLIETKGAETVEVAHKDRAATLWCESATALTGTTWRYLKVSQKEFEKLQPADFADLMALEGALD
ncbi:MAG: DEAD/DEAH box helicase family protein [Chloroflexia bacterium]